jgi:hypothetical protein
VSRPNQDAWDALHLVVGFVRHAENKAGITLAAAGIVGGMLYNLVSGQSSTAQMWGWSALSCALFTLLAVVSAAWVLWPRLRTRCDVPSLLHFDRISRDYADNRDCYLNVFETMVNDRVMLRSELAGQVWANALIARRKYRWSNLAVLALLFAVLTLAITSAPAFIAR